MSESWFVNLCELLHKDLAASESYPGDSKSVSTDLVIVSKSSRPRDVMLFRGSSANCLGCSRANQRSDNSPYDVIHLFTRFTTRGYHLSKGSFNIMLYSGTRFGMLPPVSM